MWTNRLPSTLTAAVAALAFSLAAHPSAGAETACRGRDLRPVLAGDAALKRELDEAAAAMPFGKGKFFRITKPGLASSYLFGTIHHGDPRVTGLGQAVSGALDGARIVALELAEVDRLDDPAVLAPVQSHVMAAMVARPNERAQVLLPPAGVAALEKAFVGRGQPAVMARTLRPVFMSLVLAIPACAKGESGAGQALDGQIARRAREAGRPVVGLESLADQFDSIAATPAAMQGPFLEALVRGLPYEEDAFETTTRLYVEGEIGWLLAWSRRGALVPGVDAAAPAAFYEIMIDGRNARMRDAALPLLAKGGVFIAVGAAHIPGNQGLANLIQAAGYRVERAD